MIKWHKSCAYVLILTQTFDQNVPDKLCLEYVGIRNLLARQLLPIMTSVPCVQMFWD